MKKKVIIPIIIGVVVIIGVGIGGFIYAKGGSSDKLIKQGNSLVAEGNYTAALNDYNQALASNPKNTEAKNLVNVVNGYMNAEQKYKDGDFTSAQNTLNNIDSAYKSSPIASKIDSLKSEVNNAVTVQNQINNANSLVAQNKASEAKGIITKLESENLTDSQKAQLAKLSSGVQLANKVSNDKKEVAKKESSANNKQLYLNQLANIDSQINSEPEQETQTGLNMQSYKQFKLWDGELNKIWGALKDTLPKSEMSQLTANEMSWIDMKNQKANEIKKQYEGVSIMPLEVNSELGSLTRKRCYYLVNNYM